MGYSNTVMMCKHDFLVVSRNTYKVENKYMHGGCALGHLADDDVAALAASRRPHARQQHKQPHVVARIDSGAAQHEGQLDALPVPHEHCCEARCLRTAPPQSSNRKAPLLTQHGSDPSVAAVAPVSSRSDGLSSDSRG